MENLIGIVELNMISCNVQRETETNPFRSSFCIKVPAHDLNIPAQNILVPVDLTKKNCENLLAYLKVQFLIFFLLSDYFSIFFRYLKRDQGGKLSWKTSTQNFPLG